jgi:hypothetical protein
MRPVWLHVRKQDFDGTRESMSRAQHVVWSDFSLQTKEKVATKTMEELKKRTRMLARIFVWKEPNYRGLNAGENLVRGNLESEVTVCNWFSWRGLHQHIL